MTLTVFVRPFYRPKFVQLPGQHADGKLLSAVAAAAAGGDGDGAGASGGRGRGGVAGGGGGVGSGGGAGAGTKLGTKLTKFPSHFFDPDSTDSPEVRKQKHNIVASAIFRQYRRQLITVVLQRLIDQGRWEGLTKLYRHHESQLQRLQR